MNKWADIKVNIAASNRFRSHVQLTTVRAVRSAIAVLAGCTISYGTVQGALNTDAQPGSAARPMEDNSSDIPDAFSHGFSFRTERASQGRRLRQSAAFQRKVAPKQF